MNFATLNTNVDLSSYTIGEIRYGLHTYFTIFARTLKVGGGDLPPADVTNLKAATLRQLVEKYKEMVFENKRIPPTSTSDVLLMNQNLTVNFASNVVHIEVDPHPSESETAVFEKPVVLSLPYARGFPVVKSAHKVIIDEATNGEVKLTEFSSGEIETINAITEVVVVNGGQFTPKAFEENIFRSAGVWKEAGIQIAMILNTVLEVHKKPLTDRLGKPLTAIGKNMIPPLVLRMVLARNSDSVNYKAMCLKFIHLFDIKRFSVPTKIGKFSSKTLEYAYHILRVTRGIRGGEKSDSTLAASSFYLDVTIDNRFAKSTRDLTDFKNLLAQIMLQEHWTKNIILRGKHANTLLNRLMLFEVKFSGIITINFEIPPGWTMKGDVYTHPVYRFSLSKSHDQYNDLLIDYDLKMYDDRYLAEVVSTDITNDYGKYNYVAKLGPFTNDTQMVNFLPSAFVHNLTGFHTSFDIQELVESANYIEASVQCNIARTFTMAFRDRGSEILHQHECDALIMELGTYVRIAKGFSDHQDIHIAKNLNFESLFDEVAAQGVGAFAKILDSATRKIDEDLEEDESFDDEVPDPDESENEVKEEKIEKKVAPPKSAKPKPKVNYDFEF